MKSSTNERQKRKDARLKIKGEIQRISQTVTQQRSNNSIQLLPAP